MRSAIKLFTEIGPLLGFFLAYKFFGLMAATGVLMATTLVGVIATYIVCKKVAMMPLVSALVLGVFGGLTLISNNEWFIKVKPTIINGLFAAVLLGGLVCGKGMLKYILNSAMAMNDRAWKIFSFRWALLFIGLAILNEVIWRNMSTDFWVQFKVFGMLPITVVFLLTQLPFIKKQTELAKVGELSK